MPLNPDIMARKRCRGSDGGEKAEVRVGMCERDRTRCFVIAILAFDWIHKRNRECVCVCVWNKIEVRDAKQNLMKTRNASADSTNI